MLSRMFRRNYPANLLGFITATALLTAVSVHPQTISSSDTSSTKPGLSSGTSSETSSATTVSASDRRLMRDLAQANLSEIATARLAQSKSTNEQIRTFAQKMIDDHTQALNQLQQLAQEKNVQLPTEPNAKHKATERKLSALSGTAFDKQYMNQAGVSDHRQTHRLVSRISQNAQDADLKKLGADLLPSIDQHLQMAQDMKSNPAQQSSGQSSDQSPSNQAPGNQTPGNTPE